jgi:hypothetical protein
MPMNHRADQQSAGKPSFRAAPHEGVRRARCDRGRMVASKAPGLGITPTWDTLEGPSLVIFRK